MNAYSKGTPTRSSYTLKCEQKGGRMLSAQSSTLTLQTPCEAPTQSRSLTYYCNKALLT